VRLFFCLFALAFVLPAQAAIPLSFPRAQNFLLTGAESVDDWLIPLASKAPFSGKVSLLFSRQSDVWALYQDVKSKDQTRVNRRLQESYGNLYDAAAKLAVYGRIGHFTQGLSLNAAASLLVNDPVFPDLAGLLYNNYAFFSAYDFTWASVRWRPSLVYGVRRVMVQAFTVGQLLDTKPNTKLKTLPYRGFVEAGLEASRPTPWGEILLNVKGVPVYRNDYAYWQVEAGFRSVNLLEGVKRNWPWRWTAWASFSPFYGGNYALVRTVKVGTSVEWFKFAQTDIFLMDKFRPGFVLRLGTARINAQLFSFARSEDDFQVFSSRQYGLAVSGAF
jgi:hypothetical protein